MAISSSFRQMAFHDLHATSINLLDHFCHNVIAHAHVVHNEVTELVHKRVEMDVIVVVVETQRIEK